MSVDQLVSPTPGVIAQMTGFLTTKRYKYATVYVDQFSRLGFVYLQKTASAEGTMEGKRAFEAYSKRHGVRIENYHADNGIFKANVIIDEEDRQPGDLTELLTLHHQYGHISMRKLQEMAKQRIIPKRLAKCRVLTCSACLYSKATKKPWRGKETKRYYTVPYPLA